MISKKKTNHRGLRKVLEIKAMLSILNLIDGSEDKRKFLRM